MHWTARVAVVVSILFTIIVTFQVFITIDEAQPAGTHSAFTVKRVDSPSKEAAIRAITRAARQTRTNIFKVQPGARDSTRSRTLFAFLGNEHEFQRHGGSAYPTFSRQSLATTVVPASHITTEDMRGRYVTSANHDQIATILADLSRAGVAATDDTVPGLQLFLYALGPGNLGAAFVVVYVALALTIAYSGTTNRKTHAVKSLHGYGRTPILATELASAGAVFGLGLADQEVNVGTLDKLKSLSGVLFIVWWLARYRPISLRWRRLRTLARSSLHVQHAPHHLGQLASAGGAVVTDVHQDAAEQCAIQECTGIFGHWA